MDTDISVENIRGNIWKKQPDKLRTPFKHAVYATLFFSQAPEMKLSMLQTDVVSDTK